MVTTTFTTALPTSISTVATKIHHKKKKKKKGPNCLPLPNHKTTTITNTKPRLAGRKKTIAKPRSVRRKKKGREANPSHRQAKHIHTHTHKPTTANLHKSKPIMPIHCTTTHCDPNPQPTIRLPPDSTHTPATIPTTHVDHNSKSQTHNPDPHRSQSEITNPQPRPMPITILNHKSTTHKIKSPRCQALPPYRQQYSEGVWALKFFTNREPKRNISYGEERRGK